MLTGQDLLDFVTANPDLTPKQLAGEAGYIRQTESGKEQILEKAFTHALLSAKGLPLKAAKAQGKTAKFETTVHASGVILVGKTYVERFGVEPGTTMAIELDEDCIRLVPKDELVAA